MATQERSRAIRTLIPEHKNQSLFCVDVRNIGTQDATNFVAQYDFPDGIEPNMLHIPKKKYVQTDGVMTIEYTTNTQKTHTINLSLDHTYRASDL